MKKVLILGTSHSQATCANNGELPQVFHSGRWHDYFRDDLGWEVVNLSRSSITAQQQMELLLKYHIDNPEHQFDLAVVEGRGLEANSSMPGEFNDERLWDWILDNPDEGEAPYEVDRMTPGETLTTKHTERFLPWYADYIMSMHHAIDSYSINRAMCTYLDKFCDNVRYICIGTSTAIPDDHKNYQLGKQLLSEFLFKTQPIIDNCKVDTWPALNAPDFYHQNERKYLCDCNHMNLTGHKYLWENLIKPEVKNIFKEIT